MTIQISDYISSLDYITDAEERYTTARRYIFTLTPGTDEYSDVLRIVQRAWKEMCGRTETVDTFADARNELASSGYRG